MRYLHSTIKFVIRNSHFDLFYLYSSTTSVILTLSFSIKAFDMSIIPFLSASIKICSISSFLTSKNHESFFKRRIIYGLFLVWKKIPARILFLTTHNRETTFLLLLAVPPLPYLLFNLFLGMLRHYGILFHTVFSLCIWIQHAVTVL